MNKEIFYRIISTLVLIPVVFFCIIKGSFFFNILIILSFVITCYEWNSMIKNKIFILLGFIFITLSYYCVFLIRNSFGDESLSFFLLILLICISTDIGGYIFGKILRGPKLTKISPNKTYSGMIGSFFLSILVLMIFINYSSILNLNYKTFDVSLLIIILMISTVSQLGDLIVSYFKRLSNIKNTGKIIPGHGGILDRTDGMIFAFPFSYILSIFNFL